MTDLWQWSTFLDQCDYIRMFNLDILICLWEHFVPHKSHRNIFKELPQKATASLLSKEKQSHGVICQSFEQNGPFMNCHWMVSSSDIQGILKQRCILWLTSAYRRKSYICLFWLTSATWIFKKSPSRRIVFIMPQNFSLYAPLFRAISFSLRLIAKWSFVLGAAFILWKIWPPMEKSVLVSVFFSPTASVQGK